MKSTAALILTIASVALAATPPDAAAKLAADIQALIAHSPASATAYWGIEVADASTGNMVYRSNADNFFVPASNTKVFSTALALTRLGPRFRIATTVTAAQPPDPDGNLACNLILKGAGDPSLITADLESLADQLVERGIHKIDGNIVGDDSLFPWEPYNPGWSVDDTVEGYGAPIGALTLNDNSITLHIAPNPPGDPTPAALVFDPPVPLFTLENDLQADETLPARIHYDRLPGSDRLRLWGAIHRNTKDPEIVLGVDDPARYAALVLLDALQRKGISVTGKAEVHHRGAGAKPELETYPIVLARHESGPLIEDLRLTDKTSQNLHAETYLRLVASQRAGQGSRSAGLMELKRFMDSAGIDQNEYNLQDGSGLSRLNLVTPHAMVSLLVYMAKSAYNDAWTSMLAVAGSDGTLEHRMKSKELKGRIVAKTGSLSHVTALSGYIDRKGGKRYAFSILVNNYNGPATDIRATIDKICSLLVD